MSLLRQATEGPQSSSSFSVRGAEVGKFDVRRRVWWAELVMVALNKTRKQPSTVGPRQETERNWSSTRPIYNTFLYLPFVMSDIFEGSFAKHFTCMNELNPSNTLWGVYREKPHLSMWEKRSSGRWNNHQGNWKICGYPHLPPHLPLLFVLR